MKELMTIGETVKAIRKAKLVLIRVAFGVVEREVKISKIEALEFVRSIGDDATPCDMEMACDHFGTVDDDNVTVHLG